MFNFQKINDNIYWVGTHDRRLELFENLFPLPHGITYNSYMIIDEKTALIDTVDMRTAQEYLANIHALLQGRSLDYLVINHMEPDHCGIIPDIIKYHPNVKIVGNKKTFQFLEAFYHLNVESHYYEVVDGDSISLGEKTISLHTVPMVHWPEVMVTYEHQTKTAFTSDIFGTFGALDGNLFTDQIDVSDKFLAEARRYYANIIGFFGKQAQIGLQKIRKLDIEMLAPLHGPIWRENLDFIFDKYEYWTSFTPEKKGVLVLYGTMYGNTETAGNIISSLLSIKGVNDIRLYDISTTDFSYVAGDIWKYSHIVFMAPTYNSGLYPKMSYLMEKLKIIGFRNRHVSIVGNYTWYSIALAKMKEILSEFKEVTFVGEGFDITSSLDKESSQKLQALANSIAESVLGE